MHFMIKFLFIFLIIKSKNNFLKRKIAKYVQFFFRGWQWWLGIIDYW